jgi:hypothetical protein
METDKPGIPTQAGRNPRGWSVRIINRDEVIYDRYIGDRVNTAGRGGVQN